MEAADRIKVGISKRPKVRRSTLAPEAPGLSLVYYASPGHDRARELEIKTHEILSAHRIRGEWFSVDSKTAVSAVLQAATELGLTLTSFDEERPTLLIPMDERTKAALKKAAESDRRSMAFVAEELIVEGLRRKKARNPRP